MVMMLKIVELKKYSEIWKKKATEKRKKYLLSHRTEIKFGQKKMKIHWISGSQKYSGKYMAQYRKVECE